MNNTFSLKRVALLLLMDLRIYVRVLLLFMALAVVSSLLLAISADQGLWNTQYHILVVILFSSSYYGYYVSNRIHHGKDVLLLTLPTSNMEKLVHLLLVGVSLYGLCHLLLEGAFELNSYIYHLQRTPISDYPIITTYGYIIAGIGMLYISIRFRKWGLIGVVILAIVFIILTLIGLQELIEQSDTIYGHIITGGISIGLLTLTYNALKRAEIKS